MPATAQTLASAASLPAGAARAASAPARHCGLVGRRRAAPAVGLRWPAVRSAPRRGRSQAMTARAGCAEGAVQWIEDNLAGGKVVDQAYYGSSDWSSQHVYTTEDGSKYFVKVAPGHDVRMFKGEALALNAMYDTQTLRIPKVHHFGELGKAGSFIVMEHLNFGGRASGAELGRQLAAMHLATPTDPDAAAGRFGFPVANTCGATPQVNDWSDDWVAFYRDQRLRYQLQLTGNAELQRMGDKLCANIHTFFDGITVKPSILHGDLWSGNIASVDGQPSIFDPASYYGHYEAEFGISWCAGFGQDFWSAYHEVIPREPGFEQRHQLYQLYHYLNHYNLFGSGYYSPCASILKKLTR
mmetsp:Transcript_1496/g.3632  ORF Transcript_1496/g.3632 Transcript_1496/m.3632 type:complete len:355 (+) Transcript_1496:96-1160(+)|eukprot:jgi/Tetstr1/445698/TSEL_003498.t2